MTDFDKMTKNIPESLKGDEAIASAKDHLQNDPKNDPLSAMSTAAMNLLQMGVRNATREINLMNKNLGADYPNGSIIIAAALKAAYLTMVRLIIEETPDAAMTTGMILQAAELVVPRLTENMHHIRDNKIQEPGMRVNGDGSISIILPASMRENKDDKR